MRNPIDMCILFWECNYVHKSAEKKKYFIKYYGIWPVNSEELFVVID